VPRPLLLDLFCGAGGAAMGYHRAGFDVVGVDIKPQPNYPFDFERFDALELLRTEWLPHEAAAIHASPPCQAYTLMSQRPNQAATRATHPRLIEPLRTLLQETGLPYVIENVVGAPLRHPLLVCGSMFDPPLGVQRHRLFESNMAFFRQPCRHHLIPDPIGVFGSHPDGGRTWTRKDGHKPLRRAASVGEAQRVMGIDWTDDWDDIREAVPPAFTEYVGAQLLEHLERVA
jgi:DNA (cytosine-5)-methyltransferase 1